METIFYTFLVISPVLLGAILDAIKDRRDAKRKQFLA